MNKVDYRALLHRLRILCILSLVAVNALKLFGIEAFEAEITNVKVLEFISFVDSNSIVRMFINVLKSILILNIMFAIVCRNYKENMLEMNIVFLVYSFLINLSFISNQIVIILNFSIYFLAYKYNKNILLCFYILLVDGIFGILPMILLSANYNYQDINYVIALIFSFDYILYWLLHLIDYKLGGAKWVIYLDLAEDLCLKRLMHPKQLFLNLKMNLQKLLTKVKKFACKNALKLKKLNLRFSNQSLTMLKCKVKYELPIKFKHKVMPILIIFIVFIGYAHLIDRVAEAIILYICYLSFYNMLPKHFHADYIPNINSEYVVITCVCLTSLTFCVMLFNATMFSFSIFFTVIVALIFDLLLYFIRDYLDLLAFYLKNISFATKTCTKEELINRCREKGYNEQETQVAIWMFVDKLSLMEIAEKLNIEMQSANNRKSKMKKKLES